MCMTTKARTPGYNTRLAIYFTSTKTGKRRAFRYCYQQMRAFPIGVAKAELFIAQDQADQIEGNPIHLLRATLGGAR